MTLFDTDPAETENYVLNGMQRIGANPRGVLFVCTGNLCRSPMAAALFSRRANPQSGCIVRSAGTQGVDGQPAHPLAQEQMQKRGLDLANHRARTVTPNLLMAFDLILVMELEHQAWIETRLPAVRRKVQLLGFFRNREIYDPIKGGRADFERSAEEIEECIWDWSQLLRKGVGSVAEAW